MRSRLRVPLARGLVLLLPVATMFGLSGCQLNRSFFQMDSNSRVPFFGVDLKPNWPQRKSSVDGVSRLQSDAAQATPIEAKVVSPSPRKQEPLTLPVADAAPSTDAAPIEQFR